MKERELIIKIINSNLNNRMLSEFFAKKYKEYIKERINKKS